MQWQSPIYRFWEDFPCRRIAIIQYPIRRQRNADHLSTHRIHHAPNGWGLRQGNDSDRHIFYFPALFTGDKQRWRRVHHLLGTMPQRRIIPALSGVGWLLTAAA